MCSWCPKWLIKILAIFWGNTPRSSLTVGCVGWDFTISTVIVTGSNVQDLFQETSTPLHVRLNLTYLYIYFAAFIVIYLVTQRRAKNAAEGKGNHSNHYTGLNDDNIMLSYINSQFDVPKVSSRVSNIHSFLIIRIVLSCKEHAEM